MARSRRAAVRLLVGIALVAGLLPAGRPQPALAASGLGDQLFATGGEVEVQVLSASAGYTSELWLFEPGTPRRIATNRDVGLVVNLGTFPAGVELVFGIRVLNTGNEFRMGPGTRNPDGIAHAVVTFLDPARARARGSAGHRYGQHREGRRRTVRHLDEGVDSSEAPQEHRTTGHVLQEGAGPIHRRLSTWIARSNGRH